MTDVLAYLQSKGLQLKRADARNVHTTCVFCDEDPASRGRLYISIDPDAEVPGLLFCHRCQHKGNLVTLKKHFGDNVQEDELDLVVRSEILAVAAEYYHDQLMEYPDVLAYLRGPDRGLTLATIIDHQIGYAPMDFEQDLSVGTIKTRLPRGLYTFLRSEGYDVKAIAATGLCLKAPNRDVMVDFLGGMVTIPYRTAGNVTAIRGRTWPLVDDDFKQWTGEPYDPPKAKYKTCGGTSSRIFNTDAIWEHEEVFLTEGEFDAMVLQQHGMPAIGVPGANSWQDGWDDYVAHLKRIWLIFDRDATGEKAAKKLTDRFGSKIRRIHLSEEGTKCDPTTWFGDGHTVEEFRALVVAARRGGLLVSVDEAVEEFGQHHGQEGLLFGWELLDKFIRPGIMPGQLMIILAKTGAGKTILLLNLMHMMRLAPGQHGIRILFVSLEQTRSEWWDRARRIHTFHDLWATERDAADFWREHLMIIDRNRLAEADLRQAIDDFELELGGPPDLICVDYLGYWARAFRGEAYERTTQAVMTLKGIAKEYRVPIITPHQVSRIGIDGQEMGAEAARDSGAVEETADFLFTMWSPDNALGRPAEERTGHIDMKIAKSRHGGRGERLALQFAPVSLAMVPQGHELCARARQEYGWWKAYHDEWPRMVHRHRTGDDGHLDALPGGGFIVAQPNARRFK